MNKKQVEDFGMTYEQAILRDDFLECYQFLGKYYTADAFHTVPPVLEGQCPVCGEFTWKELADDLGECDKCGFSG